MNPIDLHKHPKIKPGFKVPENYFDELESKILSQIDNEEPKVIQLKSYRKYWFSAVAAVVILAISIPTYQNWKIENDSLDHDSIESYLSYHQRVTTEDIISLLDDSDITSLQKNQSLESESIENYLLENKVLEHYLID
ncbi:hypothetical protein M0M57_15980 [Flavobacterium azooxidireducens]|uniref:Anti-sigma factor n=1 Tax=Flavobacterium azooxidireducens TaxID=1871076 RepID=A0ABY4KFM8_9FLAO|nr:hypothetical protein [Flavobacterium azooxidireducens]UPQ79106.1 hypothetical protein M0M57_15980 [Flavobacterium azooxidireducens]